MGFHPVRRWGAHLPIPCNPFPSRLPTVGMLFRVESSGSGDDTARGLPARFASDGILQSGLLEAGEQAGLARVGVAEGSKLHLESVD